jgi:hypothetical protein
MAVDQDDLRDHVANDQRVRDVLMPQPEHVFRERLLAFDPRLSDEGKNIKRFGDDFEDLRHILSTDVSIPARPPTGSRVFASLAICQPVKIFSSPE